MLAETVFGFLPYGPGVVREAELGSRRIPLRGTLLPHYKRQCFKKLLSDFALRAKSLCVVREAELVSPMGCTASHQQPHYMCQCVEKLLSAFCPMGGVW